MECKYKNCNKDTKVKGFCNNHYALNNYYKNHEINKKRWRNYRLKNLDKLKQYNKNNKEHILKLSRKRRNANKLEILEKERKNKRYRYKNDKQYKLRVLIRNRIKAALRLNLKKSSSLSLLGCTIDFLKKYLEKQFEEGMTWKNYKYNGWHIHHIKPCYTFDLSINKEQQKCFHYTNLQPVWKENHFKMKHRK